MLLWQCRLVTHTAVGLPCSVFIYKCLTHEQFSLVSSLRTYILSHTYFHYHKIPRNIVYFLTQGFRYLVCVPSPPALCFHPDQLYRDGDSETSGLPKARLSGHFSVLVLLGASMLDTDQSFSSEICYTPFAFLTHMSNGLLVISTWMSEVPTARRRW